MSEATVGAFEAKTHLSALLERAEKGESITITRHGRPVARLVPVGGRSVPRRLTDAERAEILEKFRVAREALGANMSPEEIVALVREGRGD